MKKRYVMDLFAGCGGLSLGLELAGFHPVFVNEINTNALESYLVNRGAVEPRLRDTQFHCNNVKELVTHDRIEKLKKSLLSAHGISIDSGDLDLLVGGPPCQGFSGIGHRRSYSVDKKQLPSNHLYQDMAWIIDAMQPKIFLFENVKGLMSSRWTPDGEKGEIWRDVQRTFKEIKGYKVESALVYAKDYGVPQNRPRIILVGVRDDINLASWDTLSSVANGFLPSPEYNYPDLSDVLGDLVDEEFVYGGSTISYPKRAITDIQKWFRKSPENNQILKKGQLLTEHEYSKHNNRVTAKFKYMLENNGSISEEFKTKKFAQRLLPQKWGESGPNITATSLPDDYVHFSQARILTVREWARLQGFPDWYQFSGSRTTGGIRRAGNPRAGIHERELPKYTQIGNAVPVWLAREIGLHFKKVI